MMTFEAINRAGRTVRTFSHADLAEAYRERMATFGADLTIRVTTTIVRERAYTPRLQLVRVA